jgi:hypothetical protein
MFLGLGRLSLFRFLHATFRGVVSRNAATPLRLEGFCFTQRRYDATFRGVCFTQRRHDATFRGVGARNAAIRLTVSLKRSGVACPPQGRRMNANWLIPATSKFDIRCSIFDILNFEHRTPNTEHRTPNTEHRTPNTEYRTPNIEVLNFLNEPIIVHASALRAPPTKKRTSPQITSQKFTHSISCNI